MTQSARLGGEPSPARRTLCDDDTFVALVDAALDRFLVEQQQAWSLESGLLADAFETLRMFVSSGGKRMRPRFLYWGNVAAGGETDQRLVDVGASLELLHAFALIHDDVMDGSDSRRGHRTVHQHFISEHVSNGWHGEPRRVGEGLAILLGDLSFAYSVQLSSDTPQAVRRLLDETRIELHMGQYLDLMSAATGADDEHLARSIARYKTAKYTVERPLQLGALLAGREDLSLALSEYGLAVGEAFQHRDDLLGVFGHPELTGKPVGDDLRSGKSTLLLSRARAAMNTSLPGFDRIGTDALTDEDIESIIDGLIACGAVTEVEQTIDALITSALDALGRLDLDPEVHSALAEMAQRAAWRGA